MREAEFESQPSTTSDAVDNGWYRQRNPGNGRWTTNMETVERDAKAATLRRDGWTWREIARELGFADEAGAYNSAKRAMSRIPLEGAADLRRMENERLDDMERRAREVLERRHFRIANGQIVRLWTDGDVGSVPSGEWLEDDAPVLAAVQALLKIQQRRASLNGLDAPVKVETIGYEVVINGVAIEDLK